MLMGMWGSRSQGVLVGRQGALVCMHGGRRSWGQGTLTHICGGAVDLSPWPTPARARALYQAAD